MPAAAAPPPAATEPDPSFESGLLRRAPLAWAAAAAAAGLLAADRHPAPLAVWAALAAAAGAGAGVARRARLPLAALAVAAAAACCLARARAPLPPGHVSRLTLPLRSARIEGLVVDDPVVAADGTATTLTLATRRVAAPGFAPRAATGLVRVTLHWTATDVARGDVLGAAGTLHAPSPPSNPGQPDLAAAQARRGVRALFGCWRPDRLERLGREPVPRVSAALGAARRAAQERLARLVGRPESDLLGSIVFGLNAGFDPELLSAFQTTGLMHILVASGMNVGILAWMCLGALGALGCSRRLASLLTLPVLVGYLILCGAGTPLLRSTLMFGLLVGAEALGRESSPLNAIGAAALVILAADPESLWDRSFQLSFAATFAVMALAGWFARRLARLPRWLAEAASCTLAAQLFLVPLLASSFGSVPFLGALANLAVTPVMAVFLAAGLVLLGAGGVPLLGPLLGKLTAAGLSAVLWVVEFSSRVPLASVVAPPFSRAALAAYAVWGAGALAWIAAGPPARRGPLFAWPRGSCLGGAACLAALAWRAALAPPPGDLRVTFLDVGQGLSVVIRLPSGRAILWDAGPEFSGGAVVAPALKAAGIGRLAAIVLTHVHADHAGGLLAVARQLPVDLFCVSGHGLRRLPDGPALRAVFARRGTRWRILHDGVEIAGEPGVTMRFLHPPRGWMRRARRAQALDENSAVLAIRFGDAAALLPGDVKEGGERRLLGRLGGFAPAALLQVPHHGSLHASSPPFLARVRPRDAVASAGAHNAFGHPHPAVVLRYRDLGTRFWLTARDGAVTAVSNGGPWTVAAFRSPGTAAAIEY